MDQQWKDLLTFNRSERRGIWLLLVLMIAGFGFNLILMHSDPGHDPFKIQLLLLEMKDDPRFSEGHFESSKRQHTRGTGRTDSLFRFDPNRITAVQWQLLGLSAKQASVLVNYVAKGGRFRSKEDMRKSFVISESFFNKVEPYISINPEQEKAWEKRGKEQEMMLVDINLADTSALRKLKGIGNVLALRIVNYRNALGGFHSLDQLTEVYGLRQEVIDRNRKQLLLEPGKTRPIRLNEAGEKELAAHPYISGRLAYVIIAIRNESRIRSKEDLMERLPGGMQIHPHLWHYLQY